MANGITLTFSEDEAEILIDALEADLEGYIESAKEARGNNRRSDVQAFTEAAERITAVRDRIKAALG
ncbi:MAG TPA: hypothetical protein VE567_02300 [Sphingomonas sp.]|nr:hypothetical protein [Sphingomonas sp.]